MLHKTGDRYRYEFTHETVSPIVDEESEVVIPSEGRLDGREVNQFRRLYMKTGVISQAPGSAYVEMDRTKVIVGVYGPRQSPFEYSPKAKVICDLKFATFAERSQRHTFLPEKNAQELEIIIAQALEVSVMVEKFPKSVIEINILVLEADGGVLSAAITAGSLALADAGILCYDLVACSSAAKIGDKTLLDPVSVEERAQEGLVTVAYMATLDEITQVVQSGELDVDSALSCVDLCVSGCQEMHEMMRQQLKKTVSQEKRHLKPAGI